MQFALGPPQSPVQHGISFQEAENVFLDDGARWIDDPDHSLDEERFVLLGYSLSARCLVVVHCCPEAGAVIRLISARRATAREETEYWSFQ
ncbi:MAG TPA: BrnT family toxin [Bryobacteraceae bacterium]|nr:BrnT family toxin [Bryobacteraceae bacterium]